MAGVHSASALSSLGRDSQRACDNWRVLNAIASVAGGQWPGYIDEAAKAARSRRWFASVVYSTARQRI